MATAPTPLHSEVTADRAWYTDALVDVDARVVTNHDGEEAVLFHVVWRADANDEGGEIPHWSVRRHVQRDWLLFVECLHGMRPEIDWAQRLEPARVQLAPNLEPLARHRLQSKRRILTLQELQALPPPQWLVKGHVPIGLVVAYGLPGTGKSVLAQGLSMSVASSTPWMGHQVMGGPVLYIAAEGVGGLSQRVDAWKLAHGDVDLSGMHVFPHAVEMLDSRAVDSLLADISEMDMPPVLVVIDTMARCLVGGEENSARDVGLFVAAADRIREQTGGAVLVLHHTGKAGDSERGSSALRGAADMMMSVSNDDGVLKIMCTKQKEAQPFDMMYARIVPAGNSFFVGKAEFALTPNSGELTSGQRAVLSLLTAMFGEDGATPKEIEDESKLSNRTVTYALKVLVLRGLIRKEGAGKAVRYFPARKDERKTQ